MNAKNALCDSRSTNTERCRLVEVVNNEGSLIHFRPRVVEDGSLSKDATVNANMETVPELFSDQNTVI